METTQQSSFIPKKAMVGGSVSRSGGLFPFIADIIFVIALVISIAVFGYQLFLSGSISKMEDQLVSAREAIDPNLITQLSRSDKRIISANALLEKHVTLSTFFEHLQATTLQNLRFVSFAYSANQTGEITITMKGEARTYAAVAQQANIFSEDNSFIDPQFSNLDLNGTGDVVFTFTSKVNPALVSYISQFGTNPVDTGSAMPGSNAQGAVDQAGSSAATGSTQTVSPGGVNPNQ